ncbi:hypothetical protein [Caudoviricetes sp.]|nr:hypothetical protein [Caudoviricetes sp.]UOF81535.1 hypothetical protein [Caudoviricetes sp.]
MADAHIQALAERMIDALANKPIENRADRIAAYWDANISLAFISDTDWRAADEIARLQEISRRVTR